MSFVSNFLDRYTMYQVLVTALGAYILLATALSLFGLVTYSVLAILFSLTVILTTALLTHYILVYFTKAPANVWATIITGLILFLLFTPAEAPSDLLKLALITLIAIASKYVIRYRNAHLINPVVSAAVLASLTGIAYASWWVGSIYLFPLVLIGGIAIIMKLRRIPMVTAGIIASVVMVITQSLLSGSFSADTLTNLFFVSPLIFFMTVMVTEPLTTPAGTKAQVLYGVFIGLLSNIPFTIGSFYNSPELTLLVANLLVYPLSLKGRLTLICQNIKKIAKNTYEYSFNSSYKFVYKPGQYLEWALPHHYPDKRGTRRYFTIASSPTEKQIKLAVRMPERNGSSYKQALLNFSPGSVLYGSQLSGDFTLPAKVGKQTYIFIAGGIGITPFRSQLQYLRDSKQKINGHLFYCNKTVEDVAYNSFLESAQNEVGVKITHVIERPPQDWDGESGFITPLMLHRHVTDITNSIVYISGPPRMVGAYERLLRSLNVPAKNIHTDYFPGLV